MPQLPARAYDLVRHFEGCKLTAYRDSGGVLSVGFGHTGPDVTEGMTVTQAEADRLLEKDLQAAARSVLQMASVPLTDAQLGALASFVYNVGAGRFRTSTLRVLLNKSDFAGAANQFPRWAYAAGRELPGLVKRRAAERDLFLSAA